MASGNSLKAFTFFQGFSDKQLEKLAAIARDETYEAGTQMYQKGDPARGLFLIREGKIVLVMENDMGPHRAPLQITVDVVTPGESMGWSALVEPYIYTLGALCIDRSQVVALDAVKIRELADSEPDIGYKLMQSVAKVISSRLDHTRIILVGERGLSQSIDY